jgi:hypothetical protein
VGPRAVLNTLVKRKVPSPRRESKTDRPDRPARSLVAIPTEVSRLPNRPNGIDKRVSIFPV